ncbi:MAG TPA: metal ABC transporter ATP-binding protein [Thermoanaerobaculia bacterium]
MAAKGNGAPLVEARGVTAGYGRDVVLEEVDLAIEPGDFLAILGPNGGGKTTLVKVLLGLLAPWSGEVIRRLPRGSLGYVPQLSTFDRGFPLRVEQVVQMGRLGRRGLFAPYGRDDRAAVSAALDRLGLSALARVHVRELSGGQLQRVLIARAVAGQPALLFLDEPTAAIDRRSRETLRDLLAELNRTIPIVVVTHDVLDLSPLVRHIACVNRRLHYHGPELDNEALEEVYGCPVEHIAHGVPHRVLHAHPEAGGD